mgnify:CR=1 FL=1
MESRFNRDIKVESEISEYLDNNFYIIYTITHNTS